MVEISLSGSGEGPGWVTAPGYSTAAFSAPPVSTDMTTQPQTSRSHPVPGSNRTEWERLMMRTLLHCVTGAAILTVGILVSTGATGYAIPITASIAVAGVFATVVLEIVCRDSTLPPVAQQVILGLTVSAMAFICLAIAIDISQSSAPYEYGGRAQNAARRADRSFLEFMMFPSILCGILAGHFGPRGIISQGKPFTNAVVAPICVLLISIAAITYLYRLT